MRDWARAPAARRSAACQRRYRRASSSVAAPCCSKRRGHRLRCDRADPAAFSRFNWPCMNLRTPRQTARIRIETAAQHQCVRGPFAIPIYQQRHIPYFDTGSAARPCDMCIFCVGDDAPFYLRKSTAFPRRLVAEAVEPDTAPCEKASYAGRASDLDEMAAQPDVPLSRRQSSDDA